jgi:hypothetical protein
MRGPVVYLNYWKDGGRDKDLTCDSLQCHSSAFFDSLQNNHLKNVKRAKYSNVSVPFPLRVSAIFPYASGERKRHDLICFELFANNNHLMA